MTYFNVSKEVEFDAGHRVPLHESKCRNPHGHRYKVVATLVGELQGSGAATGMVIDFTDIKVALTELVHDVYDHGFIIQRTDEVMMQMFLMGDKYEHNANPEAFKIIVVDWTPTAEEMARAIYFNLKDRLPWLAQIDVYETPTSIATFPARGM